MLVAVVLATLCSAANAEVLFERGAWKIACDGTEEKLSPSYPSRSIARTGRLAFTSDEETVFRSGSFACWTFSLSGERALNFVDGVGDSWVSALKLEKS